MNKELSKSGGRKRIVICTAGGVPHAKRGASAILFYQYVRGVLEAGWSVLHVVVRHGFSPDEKSYQEYVSEISSYGEFSAIECCLEHLYHKNRWTRKVRAVELPITNQQKIKKFNPDLYLCFDIASVGILNKLALPKSRVIWLGDLNFETVWYHNLYDAKERTVSYFRLPLTWLDCFHWRRLYKKMLSNAGCIIDASHSSVDVLAKLGIQSEYLPYPWPVKVRYNKKNVAKLPQMPTFLFFGTLIALGSKSALRFLIDKLYPELIKIWGHNGFRIYICGALNLPAWFEHALHKRPELEFKGFVDDLEDLGNQCHAVLAPIDIPVGNRSRIVTAMAYGWPIVAHKNTARGNPDLISGSNCLLASSVDDFAAHMKFAAEQPETLAELGLAARETYFATFEPKLATSKLLDRLTKTFLLHQKEEKDSCNLDD